MFVVLMCETYLLSYINVSVVKCGLLAVLSGPLHYKDRDFDVAPCLEPGMRTPRLTSGNGYKNATEVPIVDSELRSSSGIAVLLGPQCDPSTLNRPTAEFVFLTRTTCGEVVTGMLTNQSQRSLTNARSV